MTKKRIISLAVCLALLVSVILSASGCAMKIQAADMMKDIVPQSVAGKAADTDFVQSSADFALKLFRLNTDTSANSLISPLSVMLALSMTANGAAGETLEQMEKLLGGDIPIGTLNEYLYAYVKNLPITEKSKVKIANSIWFRNEEGRLTVKNEFLQKNADYYGAAAYGSPFDKQTLSDINTWVKQNTDGMIEKILEDINADAVMYLINALVFDAEWETVYKKNDIRESTFTAADGRTQKAQMMFSDENKYISSENATGFIKPYSGGAYSFVALLPNEGIDIGTYASSLTGESFIGAVAGAEDAYVSVALPKFSYEYSVSMNKQLAALGMTAAFNSAEADLSGIGNSERGNLFISDVTHKTFISVDELGTKAGAVTKVEVSDECEPLGYSVVLDRPFVYAIVDNATNLPVFIGTVMNMD